MRVLTAALAALLLSVSFGPAAAQGRTQQMADLMAYVPAALLRPAPGLGLYFHDIGAARRAVGRSPASMLEAALGDGLLLSAYVRLAGLPGSFQNALVFGLDGGWDDQVGFGPDGIAATLTVDDPPTQLMLLGLRENRDLIAAKEALMANDYQAARIDAWSALWRGDEDFAIDFDQRNGANPFGGDLGRSSRIASDGAVLAYAPDWPTIEAVAGMSGPSLADLPNVAALLRALDDPRFGDAVLVQATLLPVPWPAFNPAGRDLPGEATERTSDVGVPPWQLGILADLSIGSIDYAVAGIVYADRTTAEGVAEPLIAAWRDQRPARRDATFAELTGGTAETYIVGDEPSVLVLAIERPMDQDEDIPRNMPYHALLTSYYMGDLSLLGVR